MSRPQDMNKTDRGPLSDASKGVPFGQTIRDYEPVEGVNWRFGKPNYERVNKLYFEHRSKKHAEGSLEAVVQNLVKNWEVESHHIADIKQWKTMDVQNFRAILNGGCPADAQALADVGSYNYLLGETNAYSAAMHTYDDTMQVWGGVFADGYAWEVLQVYSGPPTVSFQWRHFGKFSGKFTAKDGTVYKGNGQILNLIGVCVAKVTADLKIGDLDIFYNPHDLLDPLLKGVPEGGAVLNTGGDVTDPPRAAGCGNGCDLM